MSNTFTGLALDLFPIINDLLTPRFQAIGEGTSSGDGSTVLSTADYPDALLRDGSRSLLASMSVVAGATIDGVDISDFYDSYIAHLSADAHDIYVEKASADTITAVHTFSPGSATAPFILSSNAQNQTITGLKADHVNKTITPGAGLTSSGALTTGTGVTLDVGAGDGMTINANDIAVNSTVVRTTRVLTAGNGMTGGGDLSADRTFDVGAGDGITVNGSAVFVDQAFGFDWVVPHLFEAGFAVYESGGGETASFNLPMFANAIESYSITPAATDTYDLGSSSRLWRKGWLSELDSVIFATNTVTLIGGWFRIGKGEGIFPADVSNVAATIDFGQTMTTNDFVEIRAALQVEYIQVGSVVTGTTYNVTRNLDLSGANTWVAGTPYSIRGYTGNGYIDLNGYDTPRIQIFTQGATYSAQIEQSRLGDLNGNWGYVAATYGMALGEYASNKPNITMQRWQAQSNADGKQDQKSKFVYPLDLSAVADPTQP